MATSEKPTVSDPKKRAFEALERRFAAAKADLHQQQQKNKKRTHEKEEEAPNKNSSSISSPKPNISSPMPSSNEGHFASQDRISSQKASGVADVEASSPAYFLLSQPVHDNLLMTGTEVLVCYRKLSRRRGSIGDKMVHELLQKGDSAQKYMQGSRGMKIDNWLLLDSFVQGRGASMGACLRSINSRSKRSKRHMSMQQHRKCGSLDLPYEFHNFNLFKPMHEMWKDYMIQLLKNNGKGQLAQCLLNADLHGAILQVVECKMPAFTGVCGIMIRETTETFGIITQDNKFQVTAKPGNAVIKFLIPMTDGIAATVSSRLPTDWSESTIMTNQIILAMCLHFNGWVSSDVDFAK